MSGSIWKLHIYLKSPSSNGTLPRSAFTSTIEGWLVAPIVYPSGRAFARAVQPICPPAPGLFSTTSACPNAGVMYLATSLITMSFPPPGEKGTTASTGFDGKSAADVGSAEKAMPITAAAMTREPKNLFMICILPLHLC